MAPRCAKLRARPGASGRRARGPMTRGPARAAALERLHGRRGFTPARAGFRCPAPTVPALRAPGTPARKPYASRSPFRSFVAALRTRAAARCARLAPGLAPGANQRRAARGRRLRAVIEPSRYGTCGVALGGIGSKSLYANYCARATCFPV